MNDEKTIQRIRERSESAIADAMDRYARLLWTVAEAVLQSVGSVEDVEECVADAFIHLWEHPEGFDPSRGTLKTYLAVITRSKACDRRRELLKNAALSLDETYFMNSLGVTDDIFERETRRVLLSAVNALGEPDREILIRRYYYRQKPKEIALALDMNIKQVDNRLYQTKKKLRSAVTD